MRLFSETEKKIIATLETNKSLIFNNKLYFIRECDKPKTSKGEPKTDIYVLLEDEDKNYLEVKISVKQKNADFLENKITDKRALEIFGDNWQEIILQLITPIRSKFFDKKLVYKEDFGNTKDGSITLGWRFEITNKQQGELSSLLPIELAEEVLSGKNLSNNKKNSYIKGKIVEGSGVAEYILPNADTLDLEDINLIFSSLITIKNYITQTGINLYFACKASNYRTLYIPKGKTEPVHTIEGNRNLSVYIDWKNINDKLDYEICFENPLSTKSKDVSKKLSDVLKSLKIKNTNDITTENFPKLDYAWHQPLNQDTMSATTNKGNVLKIASLFSGAGGLDLGFKNAGFDIVWANEYDKTIWETYKINHKKTFLDQRSICDIPNSDLPENIDGIIGGPPCQSWSLAGSMKGIEDQRGKLFYEYIRVLNHLKPKFFVVENVKGIVSKAHFNTFQNILTLFKEAGYTCHYDVVNAVDYEVPQTRERVFLVGFRNDLNINYSFPETSEKKICLKDILDGLGDAKPSNKKIENQKLSFPNHEYMTGSFSSIFMSRNRRRNFDEPSFTIQAGGRHAPIHPSSPKMINVGKDKFEFDGSIDQVRRFSVRECARIQTFPDDFIFLYDDINVGYKMIGNAVPVKLAEAFGQSIKNALKS